MLDFLDLKFFPFDFLSQLDVIIFLLISLHFLIHSILIHNSYVMDFLFQSQVKYFIFAPIYFHFYLSNFLFHLITFFFLKQE